ncbi:PadR family transcriptional regulator [Cellulomonas sp. DKR-3]|uniref:PadR family transcriptional regulator n=1 Tax=Cellulomonas fulva TaxID=2835530 RepID=A0ABS5TWZ1_9CELL|nr:PadR family transcriptional regulator [Cellulomonas fulva]MBT0993679.1 PadR family transcriptional regulator [Cellulomonas fulva]
MRHPHDGFGRRDPRPEPTDPITQRGWNERRRRPDGRYPDDAGWSGPAGGGAWRGRRGPGGPGPGPDEGWGPRGGRGFGHGGPHGHGGRGFGPGFGPGFGGPGSRGRRAGRGDIRAAVLLLLADQPMHGYQLIQEIAERTEGRWRPSPGAIYPALALLEDEGLVTIEVTSGRKMATLTEAGGTYVTEHADELGDPWAAAAERPEHPGHVMRAAVGALAGAAEQVARTGTPEQVKQAAEILDTARRHLYALLAEPTNEA